MLWAITPEGKSSNLGEVLLDGDHSKLSVTTSLQTFGLIVTAEPYFAVSSPSDAVVMENVVLPETTGTIQQMNASYQRVGLDIYRYDVARVSASYPKSKYPTVLELNEARNAVEIARNAGAPQYASDAFSKAQASLNQAELLMASGHDRKTLIQSARDAVQNAADAVRISIQARQDQEAAQERAAAAQRTAQAQADAARAPAAQQGSRKNWHASAPNSRSNRRKRRLSKRRPRPRKTPQLARRRTPHARRPKRRRSSNSRPPPPLSSVVAARGRGTSRTRTRTTSRQLARAIQSRASDHRHPARPERTSRTCSLPPANMICSRPLAKRSRNSQES